VFVDRMLDVRPNIIDSRESITARGI